jgi:5-methyltetrahydrofolate--homocysteine methyltransferase
VYNEEILLSSIKESVTTLDFFQLRSALKEAFDAGVSGLDIIKKGVLAGIKESGEIGLIVAAEALNRELSYRFNNTKEKNKKFSQKYSGLVVIGTVQGDIHDLGKNVLIALLKSVGIRVKDLGIDVSPDLFVKNAQIEGVRVIAISSLLSSAFRNIKSTISALDEAGLRKKVKIIVGGAAISHEIAIDFKADAFAKDAIKGLAIIEEWVRS